MDLFFYFISTSFYNARKDLIEKLCGISNKYFRSHIKNIYSVSDWSKTDNQALFYNIELVDTAINENKQIRFDYNKYGTDKKLHKSSHHRATPYQLILHNQRYYLMSLNEYWRNIAFYRLDKITNMLIVEDKPATPITEVDGFKSGINYKEISSALPYMYTDKSELIEFIADENIVDQIIDWFGFDINITKTKDNKVRVCLKASPCAMEHWATQYLNYVEIVKPISLRNKIKETLEQAQKKYS